MNLKVRNGSMKSIIKNDKKWEDPMQQIRLGTKMASGTFNFERSLRQLEQRRRRKHLQATTRGSHNWAQFDRYQVPVYPLHSYPQSTYQYQVNSQSRNVPSEFFYHNRGLIPNMTGYPPSRLRVGEFTSLSQHPVSNDIRHACTNLYDFEMKNYGWRKYGIGCEL